jgi:hypothetical protein
MFGIKLLLVVVSNVSHQRLSRDVSSFMNLTTRAKLAAPAKTRSHIPLLFSTVRPAPWYISKHASDSVCRIYADGAHPCSAINKPL